MSEKENTSQTEDTGKVILSEEEMENVSGGAYIDRLNAMQNELSNTNNTQSDNSSLKKPKPPQTPTTVVNVPVADPLPNINVLVGPKRPS